MQHPSVQLQEKSSTLLITFFPVSPILEGTQGCQGYGQGFRLSTPRHFRAALLFFSSLPLLHTCLLLLLLAGGSGKDIPKPPE